MVRAWIGKGSVMPWDSRALDQFGRHPEGGERAGQLGVVQTCSCCHGVTGWIPVGRPGGSSPATR